ncbi:DUF2934 domain-containing protein [Niveibacterium sp. 24ML]|uniref:DUF2934 domain-containing protein n=1 Tax=Niveibacterium sp. 24ML TaxID=2985512 RepID=UPI00226F3148|nr:DUF2934 domain-containing protein [Niveibacterium sp. 24ML]MCX9158497.1 DUF2934 domain-containing protein [Niveibacterium sp. 24ML]
MSANQSVVKQSEPQSLPNVTTSSSSTESTSAHSEREALIASAAYYLAERRGFCPGN